MSHIIPFPKRNDPSSAQDFPMGRHVLAVYPGTTALYKATVVLARKVSASTYFSSCVVYNYIFADDSNNAKLILDDAW